MAEDVITTSLDLRRMVQEAEAAGFNPLSVLRNGGAAGFMTQRTQYADQTASQSGSFTAPSTSTPVSGGDGYSAPSGSVPVYSEQTGLPGGGRLLGYRLPGQSAREYVPFDHQSGGVNAEAYDYATEASEFNIAVHQLRMRTGEVITDDGVHIRTRGAVPQSGGMFNPITYGAAAAVGTQAVAATAAAQPTVRAQRGWVPGTPYIEREGFQERQVYQTDKLPNVIDSDTVHWLLPGVPFYEQGGATRGETWETTHGEGGGEILALPKTLADVGYTFRRWWSDAGVDFYDNVIKKQNVPADAAYWASDPYTRPW